VGLSFYITSSFSLVITKLVAFTFST